MAFPPLPPVSALVLLSAILAVAGLVRGFSGFGAALVAMPVMSALLGPRAAVAVLALVDIALLPPLLVPALRRCDGPTVLPAALAAFATAPLGAYVLATADPIALRWGLIVIVALMLMLLVSGWRYHGRPMLPASLAVGGLSGVFGGAAGISGPPIVAYWLSGPAPAGIIRANLIVFFAVSGLGSLLSYAVAGLFTAGVAALSVVALPGYALAIWIGAHLHGRASDGQFRAFAFVLIALSALLGLPVLDPFLRGG